MDDTREQVRKALGHMTMEWTPSRWLDTGIPDLNRVLGHKTRGLPYGRITEVSGWESHGKSAIFMSIAALAQRDGAVVIWGDLENSWENDWAKQRGMMLCPDCQGTGWTQSKRGEWHYCKTCGVKRVCSVCLGRGCKECHDSGEEPGAGLDWSRLVVIQPYVGQFEETGPTGKKKLCPPRLTTGVELLNEMEKCAELLHKKHDRIVMVVDSLASILTEGEEAAGLEGVISMRVGMDLPVFLGRLLRRWVGRAQVYNAAIVLTNQLRSKPGVKFGSPLYTPGGNAPLFYSHVRVRVKRVGKIMEAGRQVGIMGTMTAIKNKTGGEQWAEVGYRLRFDGPVEFLAAKDVRRDGGDE